MVMDIFDVISPDDDELDDSAIEIDGAEEINSLKSTLSTIQKQIAEREKKREESKKKLTAEIKSFIQSEVSKVKIQQNVIERTIEKKIIEPRYIEPKVIEAPPAPPQIIKEVRVEVQTEKKDPKKYVEASKFNDLLVTIGKLEAQLKETRRMAESPIVVGGPGVIGIPPPEPKPVGYVLTINDQKKAEWKVATATGGGSSSDAYTVSNVSTDRSYDAASVSLDEIANVLGSLIQSLQGAGIIQ